MREKGDAESKEWDKVKDTDAARDYIKSRPTIVMFHANAGNLGHRIPLARKFVSELHCNVFMLSYRGCVVAGFLADSQVRTLGGISLGGG